MDNRARDLFARYVLESLGLSQLEEPGTAIITRGTSIIATGYRYPLEESAKYCTSAVLNALFEYVLHPRVQVNALSPDIMFSSYFPSLEEFKAIGITDIRTVYYMGDITDPEAVKFLNVLTRSNKDDGFEIIKLKI